jgi:hypothetical protein
MASKNPQTAAKRAREQALREKRERKRQRRLDAAAARLTGPEKGPETDAEAGTIEVETE